MKRNYIYSIMATLLLAVVALLFFYPDAVEGNVLQQHDIMQGIANGEEGRAFHEATGQTTRWTDSLFGGMPNFQISPSYPSSTMLDWIAKVYMLGLPSPANLLFAMMLGFFIMCLCMDMRWYTALLGAVAWGFSTYFIIIIGAGHIWKFVTLAYIPPTIGGIALCFKGKYLPGGALAALFGSLQLQSNHPQMSYYFMLVMLAFMIAWGIEAYRKREMKRWGIALGVTVVAGTLAVAANSPSLYNSWEYSKETVRGVATEIPKEGVKETAGMSRAAITAWSYGPDETFTLLIPNVKGGASIKPIGGTNAFLSLASAPAADDIYTYPGEMEFIGQFPQYFGNQPMTNGPVYVGAFVLLLAILAMLVCEGPMKWCLFGVSILAILLSWGHNLQWFTDLFIDYFPAYSKFRTVSSILVIVEFTIPLLAVMCIRKMLEDQDFIKKYLWQTVSVFGVGALICFVGWVAPSVFGQPFSAEEQEMLMQAGVYSNPQYANVLKGISEIRLAMVSADCLRSLLFIILGAGITFLYLYKVIKPKPAFVLLLAAVVLADLFAVNKRYVNSENFTAPADTDVTFRKTAADEAILRDKSNYRVLDLADFSGARSSYFHKTIGGYHAAKLTRYNDLIEHQIKKSNMNVLNMLNAKYFLSGDSYEINPDALGNAWWVDSVGYVKTAPEEMKALDNLEVSHAAVADARFANVIGEASPIAVGDTIYETTYAPNRLTYKSRSANGGVAVFSEIFFPWGWTATIDGKEVPIGRVNYVLRAIRVPAGEHDIEFVFDPKSVRVTNTISIVAISAIYIICFAALLIFAWRLAKRRKSDRNVSNGGNSEA